MSLTAVTAFDANHAGMPTVQDPPARLLDALADRRLLSNPWALMRHALLYAAESEQRLAALRERVAHLESLSMADDLTGLYNRRGFLSAFERTLLLAERHGGQGLLIYLDLDDFKQINDTYGHAAGDALLRRTGEVLRAGVRASDLLARLGGDEFAVVLVEADREGGTARVESLDASINAAHLDWEGVRLPIRASLGTTPYRAGDVAQVLLSQADHHMYRRKRRGRAR